MGTKLKIAGSVKVTRDLGPAAVRRRPARPTGLYLLELRSHLAQAQSPSHSRKLIIAIDPRGGSDGLPQTVRITHG